MTGQSNAGGKYVFLGEKSQKMRDLRRKYEELRKVARKKVEEEEYMEMIENTKRGVEMEWMKNT